MRGAGLVIGIDSVPKRQKLARIYGADAIVDHTGEDATDRSMELTNGEGVYSAIEALGSEQTLQNAIKVTKPSGTISNVGYHGKGDYVGLPRLDWGVGDGGKTHSHRSLYGRPIAHGTADSAASNRQFKASHIRAVPMTKDKRPSEVFAAITRWIDAKMVKRKSRGVYERVNGKNSKQ